MRWKKNQKDKFQTCTKTQYPISSIYWYIKNQSIAISKNTDKALQDSSSSLRRYIENSKILQESTEKSKNVIEEFNRQASDITRKISRINIPADKFEKLESVDDIVKTQII